MVSFKAGLAVLALNKKNKCCATLVSPTGFVWPLLELCVLPCENEKEVFGRLSWPSRVTTCCWMSSSDTKWWIVSDTMRVKSVRWRTKRQLRRRRHCHQKAGGLSLLLLFLSVLFRRTNNYTEISSKPIQLLPALLFFVFFFTSAKCKST